ncbi:MAG: hypothetical protein ABL907_23450, partial [Hyphomicrobium sp.]
MDEAVNENFPGPMPNAFMGPSVMGHGSSKSEDAGPWVHVPSASSLPMPVQDFAAKVAVASEPRRRG